MSFDTISCVSGIFFVDGSDRSQLLVALLLVIPLRNVKFSGQGVLRLLICQSFASKLEVHQIFGLFRLSLLLCKFVLQLIGRFLEVPGSGKREQLLEAFYESSVGFNLSVRRRQLNLRVLWGWWRVKGEYGCAAWKGVCVHTLRVNRAEFMRLGNKQVINRSDPWF